MQIYEKFWDVSFNISIISQKKEKKCQKLPPRLLWKSGSAHTLKQRKLLNRVKFWYSVKGVDTTTMESF